jgi:flavin reductase (DIM6/NTAB) family NADH-FMN oxidoreductase RutF
MREGFMPPPVTFISTISRNGVRNIAPWSCIMPALRPLDHVSAASAKKRDTLQNVREIEEFVLNLAGADMADKVVTTARHSPSDEHSTLGLLPNSVHCQEGFAPRHQRNGSTSP